MCGDSVGLYEVIDGVVSLVDAFDVIRNLFDFFINFVVRNAGLF